MDRPDHRFTHEWHVAINRFHAGKIGTDGFQRWLYEAKVLADEVPRLAMLFAMEREGKLTDKFKFCSHSADEPVAGNHLTCALGSKTAECPYLAAVASAALAPEQIDMAKAWTCATHIVSNGGDVSGEGYIQSVEDRMYWDRLYENLADPEPSEKSDNG